MNRKYQRIRQAAKRRAVNRTKRNKEAQIRFEADRIAHQAQLLKESYAKEIQEQTFKRPIDISNSTINNLEVLDKKKTVGFNKELFDGGRRES